jgi:hypothetical protein
LLNSSSGSRDAAGAVEGARCSCSSVAAAPEGEIMQEGRLDVCPQRADVSSSRKSRLKPPGSFTLELNDQFVGDIAVGILCAEVSHKSLASHLDTSWPCLPSKALQASSSVLPMTCLGGNHSTRVQQSGRRLLRVLPGILHLAPHISEPCCTYLYVFHSYSKHG